jgi:hypothetical protein
VKDGLDGINGAILVDGSDGLCRFTGRVAGGMTSYLLEAGWSCLENFVETRNLKGFDRDSFNKNTL